METGSADILVIGVGNDRRGDDAVGLLVARRLRQRRCPGVSVVEAQGESTRLLDLWAGATRVYLVDAVVSGAPAGSVLRLGGPAPIPAASRFHCSTHGLDLTAAIELARALNRLPQKLVIYGIEGAAFTMGAAISPEAQRGAAKAVAAILEELGCGEGAHHHA